MKLLSWTLTILFALAGLALRDDGGQGFVAMSGSLSLVLAKGCFLLAFLACPFIWARPDGLAPDALAIPGKNRFMMGLALVIAAPLILRWGV